MCDWVTLLYSRKLTEHYKPAMMEKIKIIKKKKKRKEKAVPLELQLKSKTEVSQVKE